MYTDRNDCANRRANDTFDQIFSNKRVCSKPCFLVSKQICASEQKTNKKKERKREKKTRKKCSARIHTKQKKLEKRKRYIRKDTNFIFGRFTRSIRFITVYYLSRLPASRNNGPNRKLPLNTLASVKPCVVFKRGGESR